MISQHKISHHINYCPNFYYSRDEPTFFIEPSNDDDFASIFFHRGFRIIVWNKNGVTFMTNKKITSKIKKLQDTYHIAFSNTTSNLLEKNGIDHFLLPNFPSQFFYQQEQPNTSNVPPAEKNVVFLDIPLQDGELEHPDLYIQVADYHPDLKFIVNINLEKYQPIFFKKLITKFNIEAKYILDVSVDLPSECFLSINLSHQTSANIYQLGQRDINTINNEGTPFSLDWRDLSSINKIVKSELARAMSSLELDENIPELEFDQRVNEIDFYYFPFKKYQGVTTIYLAPDLYKVTATNTTKSSNPGVYQEHYLLGNSLYLIKARGYKNFTESDVNLWIASKNNKKEPLLFSPHYSLPNSYQKEFCINYLFYSSEEKHYVVGLLFDNPEVGDSFIFQSLEVIAIPY